LPIIFAGKSFSIQVSFGAHCFTRESQPGDTPDLAFMDGNRQRTFCVNRYAHSLHLPAAVCAATNGDVCQSNGSYVFDSTLPGLAGPYCIAFSLRKMTGKRIDVRMDVRSAHHRPNLNQSLPKAKFGAVLNHTMTGAPVRWAKK
jgi:hypothetical protein